MSKYREQPSDPEREAAAAKIEQAFAARLRAEKARAGVTLRKLTRLMDPDHPKSSKYPCSTISEKLNGKTRLDWDFVEAFLRGCYRARGRENDLDLAAWRADYDERSSRADRTRRGVGPPTIGPVPNKTTSFQPRSQAHTARALLSRNATVVVFGLDGVGKTQLAAELARALVAAGEVDTAIWVTASSNDALVAGLAKAARALGISGDADQSTMAHQLLESLGEPNGPRRLMVFDDLRVPAEAYGFLPLTVDKVPTIVTTNRQDAALDGSDRHLLRLGPFEPEESLRYLRQRLELGAAHQPAAELLAADLGHLPAALAQAAAFMKDKGLDCQAYRDRLRDSSLVAVAPDSLPDEHAEPVARTLLLSVERADELEPRGLARPMLELAAHLDPNGIPIELFTSVVATRHGARRRGRATTGRDVEDALHNLRRLSLVDFDTSFTRLRVNRIVQRAVRESIPAAAPDEAAGTAAGTLLATWPDGGHSVELERLLRANAFALLDHAGEPLWHGGLDEVVFRAGDSLFRDGLHTESVELWERLLPVATTRLGPDHPDTLSIRNNRAWAYGRAGDPQRALAELRKLLPVRELLLGPDDVNTLATRHGIAIWQSDAGDPSGAAAAMQKLLADYIRVLDPTARDTLITRLSLAVWLGKTDGPDAGVTALQALVDDSREARGAERPATLDVGYHHAQWLRRAGRLPAAGAQAERLGCDCTGALGPDHLDTHAARRLLAILLSEAGDGVRALDEMRRLHPDVVRVHGADHLLTQAVENDLALMTASLAERGASPPPSAAG